MPLDQAIVFVDPDDALEELGLDDSQLARVERLLNTATSRLERALNTVLKPREFTRRFSGGAGPVLDLGGPILAVHNVTVDGVVQDPAGYTVDGSQIILEQYGWPIGFLNVVVTCRLGWDPIPHEARDAVVAYVRRLHAVTGSGDLRSERIGDYSYERFGPGENAGSADLPDDVEAMVGHLRRWRFG